jgi:hypothetical protein
VQGSYGGTERGSDCVRYGNGSRNAPTDLPQPGEKKVKFFRSLKRRLRATVAPATRSHGPGMLQLLPQYPKADLSSSAMSVAVLAPTPFRAVCLLRNARWLGSNIRLTYSPSERCFRIVSECHSLLVGGL